MVVYHGPPSTAIARPGRSLVCDAHWRSLGRLTADFALALVAYVEPDHLKTVCAMKHVGFATQTLSYLVDLDHLRYPSAPFENELLRYA